MMNYYSEQYREHSTFHIDSNYGVLGWVILGFMTLESRSNVPQVSISFLISVNGKFIGERDLNCIIWGSDYDWTSGEWSKWKTYVDELKEYEPQLPVEELKASMVLPVQRHNGLINWALTFGTWLAKSCINEKVEKDKWQGRIRILDFPRFDVCIRVEPSGEGHLLSHFSFEVEEYQTMIGYRGEGDQWTYEIRVLNDAHVSIESKGTTSATAE